MERIALEIEGHRDPVPEIVECLDMARDAYGDHERATKETEELRSA